MQRKFNLVLLIFLFVLSGCVPKVAIKKAPPDTSVIPSGEDVLIFGGIRWIENGEERKNFLSFSGLDVFKIGFKISLQVLRVEDMKEGTIEVEKDGKFFVLLPKGTYIIHRLDWEDIGRNWLVPKVAFKITEDPHSYYLGTLNIDIKTKRNFFGDPMVKELEIHIEDEEGKAREVYQKRYPQQDVQVAKALMIHNPSIPRIQELETQKTTLDAFRHLLGVVITSPPLSP